MVGSLVPLSMLRSLLIQRKCCWWQRRIPTEPLYCVQIVHFVLYILYTVSLVIMSPPLEASLCRQYHGYLVFIVHMYITVHFDMVIRQVVHVYSMQVELSSSHDINYNLVLQEKWFSLVVCDLIFAFYPQFMNSSLILDS